MAYKELERLPLKEMGGFQDMMVAGVAYRPGDEPVSVREFLTQQTGKAPTFLTSEGRLNFGWYLGEMLKMEPQQLISFLVCQTKLEEIGEATSEALDTELANGFNRHDLPHFLRNTLRAHQILELIQARNPQAKLTKGDFNLATLAAMLHDWGNLQGRKNHWTKSLLWLEKVFIDWTSPNLTRAKAILQEAIFFHDEKALLKTKETGFLQNLHPVTKTLFIADKMDVRSQRVSKLVVGQSTDQDIVDLDPHITLAAAVASEEIAIAGDRLRWQLTTDWNEYLDIVFPASYPTHWRERVRWPSKFFDAKDLNQGYGLYFAVIYQSRLSLMMQSLFSLLPELKEVVIEIGSKISESCYQSEGQGVALTFSRENFETQLGEIVRENQDLADLSGRYEPFAESMRIKLAIRGLAEKIRFWPLPNGASTEGGWICLRRIQVKQRQDLASSDWEVCPEGKLIGQWTRAGQYWEWALFPDGQLKKRQVVYDDSWQVVEGKPWQKEHTIAYLKWQESLEEVLNCWQRLEAEGAIDHRISCEGGFLVAALA